ncbi:hypothetical protein PP1Y_Spl215 (plasmid) [Novosphingobium sp. PP1Y]|nr:hypothetical protein PP1Y_Spl215 [Novosphingobium sp. PP1Y]
MSRGQVVMRQPATVSQAPKRAIGEDFELEAVRESDPNRGHSVEGTPDNAKSEQSANA